MTYDSNQRHWNWVLGVADKLLGVEVRRMPEKVAESSSMWDGCSKVEMWTWVACSEKKSRTRLGKW